MKQLPKNLKCLIFNQSNSLLGNNSNSNIYLGDYMKYLPSNL